MPRHYCVIIEDKSNHILVGKKRTEMRFLHGAKSNSAVPIRNNPGQHVFPGGMLLHEASFKKRRE